MFSLCSLDVWSQSEGSVYPQDPTFSLSSRSNLSLINSSCELMVPPQNLFPDFDTITHDNVFLCF